MYYGYYYDPTYIFIVIGFLITLLAQAWVNGSYSKYKKIGNHRGISGREVARKILDANGLSNVKVVEVAGTLTDHYDPTKKQVSLSTDIYRDSSVASMAVAAHECGHAIQDKVGYTFLRIRHKIVPTVNLCTKLGYFVIFIGFLFGFFEIAMIGFILLCAILLFQLVTLPVEFNASKRAKEQLKQLEIADERGNSGVRNMLTAAAMTYVASLASTLLQLFRMLLIILSRRRDDN
ncbi:MAG: zinc metallopeptidase [Erysipelotrichaceae bacterium]|nr:zinc metallopeptidase [Erysipelotrichaceae bacterium]